MCGYRNIAFERLMKNRAAVHDRFVQDPVSIRLGGLVSSLARIRSFSDNPQHKDVVRGLLDECKHLIEWTVADADLGVKVELLDLQRRLARWHLKWDEIWKDEDRRTSVTEEAGRWSARVLELLGLLPRKE